jgi:hypothetical protein
MEIERSLPCGDLFQRAEDTDTPVQISTPLAVWWSFERLSQKISHAVNKMVSFDLIFTVFHLC